MQVSHSAELNAAGYSFFVMPDTFIIHAEHGVPRWRGKGDFVRLCLFPPPHYYHPFHATWRSTDLTCWLQVRVRVWFNYYSFLGEMMLRHNTEVQPHSHLYEGTPRSMVPARKLGVLTKTSNRGCDLGRDWTEEEGSVAMMAGPVYATGLLASLVLFAYAVTRCARSRRTGRSL